MIPKGKLGEQYATLFLKEKGYKVLEQNWRYHKIGELDIVCQDDQELVFIEVKSRTGSDTLAFSSVDDLKQRKIRQLAEIYLESHALLTIDSIRFDVIAVLFDRHHNVKELNHIQDAFYS